MKRSYLLNIAALLLGLMTACSSYNAKKDRTLDYVSLDEGVAQSVRMVAAQAVTTSDGRLDVTAQLQNLLNRRIEVQVDCVFKDLNGNPTNDESSFRTLILTENAVEPVHFTSLNSQAKRYTIRVRQAR